MLSDMNRSKICASEVTFARVLRSCGTVLALCLLRQVHGLIVKYGCGLVEVALGSECGLIDLVVVG